MSQLLRDLGYTINEEIYFDDVNVSAETIYEAEICGLAVMGNLNTLLFLAQALSQNRENTKLWKDLVKRKVRK